MANVDRHTIKKKVVRILSAVSNKPKSKIREKDSLKKQLLLSSAMIKALAAPYTEVSKSHGGKRITISEAGKLETVKESIDLVHKKANS
jgi:hypothetical protein